jgi:hypothetical protein
MYGNMQAAQMSGSLVGAQMSLAGRIVDNFESITANDIPMDNAGAIFIKSDGMEIQKKYWGNDGLIKTTSYKRILDTKDAEANTLSSKEEKLKIDLSDEFTARFDEVMNKLGELEKSITGKRVVKNDKRNTDDVSTGNEQA